MNKLSIALLSLALIGCQAKDGADITNITTTTITHVAPVSVVVVQAPVNTVLQQPEPVDVEEEVHCSVSTEYFIELFEGIEYFNISKNNCSSIGFIGVDNNIIVHVNSEVNEVGVSIWSSDRLLMISVGNDYIYNFYRDDTTKAFRTGEFGENVECISSESQEYKDVYAIAMNLQEQAIESMQEHVQLYTHQ